VTSLARNASTSEPLTTTIDVKTISSSVPYGIITTKAITNNDATTVVVSTDSTITTSSSIAEVSTLVVQSLLVQKFLQPAQSLLVQLLELLQLAK